MWRCPEVGMTSVLRNKKTRMWPMRKEVRMLKEKKATVVHKGLCERNLGLGLVSFLSCFYFIYLFILVPGNGLELAM